MFNKFVSAVVVLYTKIMESTAIVYAAFVEGRGLSIGSQTNYKFAKRLLP